MNDNKYQNTKASNHRKSNRSNQKKSYNNTSYKESNKNIILFKSFAISLGIILLVMMISLVFKINNKNNKQVGNCNSKEKTIDLKSPINKIENIANNKIIAVTKGKNGLQEVLVINKCLEVEAKKTVRY